MATEYISEIHRLLRIGDHSGSPAIHGVPEGLPVEGEYHQDSHANVHEHKHVRSTSANTAFLDNSFINTLGEISQTAGSRLKGLLVYPVIFVVAFIFFYAVLNFSSLIAQVQGFFAAPQDQQILGDQLQPYYQWIKGYYYAVSDTKLLDPNNDIDKDGLSNMDEFVMRTNPTIADSDSDGFSDGIEVLNNFNPWGAGVFTSNQKDLAAKLDQSMVSNRIGYNVVQDHPGQIAGANTLNYDLSRPGRLSVPKLNMSVPLIWSKDPADFEKDLTQGVIHYPGTALPGIRGTVYVSGHSSDYIWKRDPMQNVFTKINFLKPGDDVFVDVYGLDGKVYNYRYQVTGSHIYKPDDQTQFIDEATNKLNLSTCWPIGTSTNRIVVSAEQVAL